MRTPTKCALVALALLLTGAGAVADATGPHPGRSPGGCFGAEPTIVGTPGTDQLTGTPGSDVIAGRGGGDLIQGQGGRDLICAGRGDDVVNGSTGNDKLTGNGGNDIVVGGPGSDHVAGSSGKDQVLGKGATIGFGADRDRTSSMGKPARIYAREGVA